ncbi:MAG: DUF479 domain-containing protein [Gammaproteobacteria bacterium]|nr:MAG: DUF479 domain-containing protein [Gammaproteobacteria bacterium]
MNWLAHAYLSKQNIEFLVGNILPDLVSITELKKFSAPFQEGISCHKAIDAFTDSHPIVKNGISRMPANYKRYGGILTDVFYDHFLAKNWALYSSEGLGEFSRNIYRDLSSMKENIPDEILYKFKRIFEHNIFESYKDISGIKIALQRIDLRLRKPADLGSAVAILEQHYDLYESEFTMFFAELQKHVSAYIIEN